MIPKLRISVNADCNFQCIYCPRGPAITMENYSGVDEPELQADELIGILRVMKECGLEKAHFTGGEPLLRPDLVDVIRRTASLGLDVELNTNGFGLTENIVSALKDAGVKLLKISLDAADRVSFREITGVDGFAQVTAGIQAATRVMPVRLNTVVMRRNLPSLLALISLADKMKVPAMHLLDLTYYPGDSAIDFFRKEFVDLSLEVRCLLERKFGKSFRPLYLPGCNFSEMIRDDGETTIVLKEADVTMRNPEVCDTCLNYCHEGVFTLRLSSNGFLNVCPTNNHLGIDARKALANGSLKEAMDRYSELFAGVRPCDSFATFVQRNGLVLSGGRK